MNGRGSKPVAFLTLDELLAEIEATTEAAVRRILDSEPRKAAEKGRYVYGLNGLAGLLGCSKTTACRVKASGMIDEAITQIGAILIIDADKALELAREADRGRRRPRRQNK